MPGVTAVRPALVVLAVLAVTTVGCVRDVGAPRGDSTRPFEVRVIDEIRAIFPDDPDLFRVEHRPDTDFVFYGDDPDHPLVALPCRETVFLSLIWSGQPKGHVTVARCPEHAARLGELTRLAPAASRAALDRLRRYVDEAEDEDEVKVHMVRMLAIAGLYGPGQTSLPGGETLHYFLLILEVHGVWIGPTLVLLDGRQAIVVQALITELCHVPLDERSGRLRLCTDTRNGLAELARRLR
jgi:hypothetical protein